MVVNLLFESSFMTLATADSDGLPWVSPVEFVCDENLAFYRVSMTNARHSQNVRANLRAASSIYDSTQIPGVSMVQGLYGEGPVEEIAPSELESIKPAVIRWISWRDVDRGTPRPIVEGRLDDPDSPWRTHRIVPSALYALDQDTADDGTLVDSRMAIHPTDHFRHIYRSRLT